MRAAGVSIDNLSLMALAVSVGFVVDDAIVMIENVFRNLERGFSPLRATLQGARQIGFTVVSISVSLIAAFIPFASSYKGGWWLSLGAVAVDLLIALVITSLLRMRIGHRAWRRLHWAAYVCWPVALLHGLGIGTDTTSTAVFTFTLFCVASVAAVATWRFVTARMRAA